MPKPYPRELRERVLGAYDQGRTLDEVAEDFHVSRTTVVAWVRLRRATGDVEPLPRGGGNPSRVDPDVLEELLGELPDGTRDELTVMYNQKVPREQQVHTSSIYRALLRLGYVSKKKSGVRPSRNAPTS